jgi:hypothetical protein
VTVCFSCQISGQNDGSFSWFYRDSNENFIEKTITNLVLTPTQASFPIIAGKQFGFNVGAGRLTAPLGTFGTRDVTIGKFAVTTQLNAAPLLKLFLTSANSVPISWPSSSTGWGLQVNANLTTTNWMDMPHHLPMMARTKA